MDADQESASTTNTETKIEAFSIAMYEASSKVIYLKVGWEYTIVEFPVTLLQVCFKKNIAYYEKCQQVNPLRVNTC